MQISIPPSLIKMASSGSQGKTASMVDWNQRQETYKFLTRRAGAVPMASRGRRMAKFILHRWQIAMSAALIRKRVRSQFSSPPLQIRERGAFGPIRLAEF